MDASEVRSLMEAYASIYKEAPDQHNEEFNFVVDYLIAEGIAEDTDEAIFMIDNEIDEETINEILGLLKKKKDKSKPLPAGRSMIPTDKKPSYVVDKDPPKMDVYKFGKSK